LLQKLGPYELFFADRSLRILHRQYVVACGNLVSDEERERKKKACLGRKNGKTSGFRPDKHFTCFFSIFLRENCIPKFKQSNLPSA
jgi:hypothetical protein